MTLFLGLVPEHGFGAWVQKANFGGTAKHRCTGFSINNKGYIGGGHINAVVPVTYQDYWEYDPGTNIWTQIADFGGGYRYHATAFTIGDYGYVGLGEDDLGNYHTDFWKYIPLINTWVQVSAFPGDGRRGACAFVVDNKGYVGTGQTEAGYATDFFFYDPLSNEWTPISDFIGEARSSAVAFAANGKGYVGTGHVIGDDRNDFFEYDPITNSWSQKANVGGLPRQDATGFVLDNAAYIGTGNNAEGTDNFGDFWKYDFENDVWTEVAQFDGQARRYMVSFVIGDVAFCGTGTNGTNMRDFWAFYPLLDIDQINQTHAWEIHPNPANEFIYISNLTDCSFDQVLISDLSGKILLDQGVNKDEYIDLSLLSNGIYLVTVLNKNQFLFCKKIEILK